MPSAAPATALKPISMGWLDRLIHGTGAVCRAGALICGGLCVLVSFVIAVAVVMRKLFNVSIVGADEISSFILAASCSWGFAFALLHRAHVRVESLQLVLPRRLCAVLDLVGLILLGAFVAVICWYTAGVLALSLDMGALADMLDVPLWIPQAFWVAGFLVSVALAVLLLIRSSIAFVAGDLATLQAMIGSRSATDEAAQETSRIERHSGGSP